jgi:hypothetical protein
MQCPTFLLVSGQLVRTGPFWFVPTHPAHHDSKSLLLPERETPAKFIDKIVANVTTMTMTATHHVYDALGRRHNHIYGANS